MIISTLHFSFQILLNPPNISLLTSCPGLIFKSIKSRYAWMWGPSNRTWITEQRPLPRRMTLHIAAITSSSMSYWSGAFLPGRFLSDGFASFRLSGHICLPHLLLLGNLYSRGPFLLQSVCFSLGDGPQFSTAHSSPRVNE